jgi:hypothetical protein
LRTSNRKRVHPVDDDRHRHRSHDTSVKRSKLISQQRDIRYLLIKYIFV